MSGVPGGKLPLQHGMARCDLPTYNPSISMGSTGLLRALQRIAPCLVAAGCSYAAVEIPAEAAEVSI